MKNTIYKLSEEEYAGFASEIKGRLMSPCYFNGTVEIIGRTGESLRLTASLILYRRRIDKRNHYELHDSICNVSAVWWDFVCEGDEGIIYDDFDFTKFSSFLIEEE